MRSVVIDGFGEPADVLSVREMPLPQPGPGEVRVALILSPIHTHDLEIVKGEYGHRPTLPMTPGTEAVGRIDALGEGVTHLQVGQRVCVAGASGTWAEYFVARAGSAVPVPDELPDEAACQLLAMPLSGALLFEDMGLAPGDWVVQNASNGAIGRVVNVLARKRGVRVMNLVRSEAAVSAMQSEGWRDVVSTSDPHWRAAVDAATRGAKVSGAIDSLGGDAANELLCVLGDGGTLVSFGSMVSLTLNLHVAHLLYRQITVRGYWASQRAAALPPTDRARRVSDLVRMVLAGELTLTVDSSHALRDAAAAALALGRPARGGKVVLRPG